MKKQKKAYKIVIDYIKQQIRNRELMIGELLPPERELSEKLGVSRNSIREALKILSVIGVISSRQGAGNYVSCDFDHYLVDTFSMMFILGELDYDQINQIRIGLEMQAYALAVKYADNWKNWIGVKMRKRILYGIRRFIMRSPRLPEMF